LDLLDADKIITVDNMFSISTSLVGIGDITDDGKSDIAVAVVDGVGEEIYLAEPKIKLFSGQDIYSLSINSNLDTLAPFKTLSIDTESLNSLFFPDRFTFGSVKPAGDIDKDGIEDIVITAGLRRGGWNLGGSRVINWLVHDLDSSTNCIILSLEENYYADFFHDYDDGASIVEGGFDFNGDAFDDFMIGAPFNVEGGLARDVAAGKTYLFFGSSTFESTSNMAELANKSFLGRAHQGASYRYNWGEFLGGDITSIGDINDDGSDDILLSAQWNGEKLNSTGEESNVVAGKVYLIFGSDSELPKTSLLNYPTTSFVGANMFDMIGRGAGLSDVNNDGIDDFAISSGTFQPNGVVYLVLGNKTRVWPQGAIDLSKESVCGDGVVNEGEQCDTDNLDRLNCWTIDNFNRGNLSCTANCQLNITECFYDAPQCNDGMDNEQWPDTFIDMLDEFGCASPDDLSENNAVTTVYTSYFVDTYNFTSFDMSTEFGISSQGFLENYAVAYLAGQNSNNNYFITKLVNLSRFGYDADVAWSDSSPGFVAGLTDIAVSDESVFTGGFMEIMSGAPHYPFVAEYNLTGELSNQYNLENHQNYVSSLTSLSVSNNSLVTLSVHESDTEPRIFSVEKFNILNSELEDNIAFESQSYSYSDALVVDSIGDIYAAFPYHLSFASFENHKLNLKWVNGSNLSQFYNLNYNFEGGNPMYSLFFEGFNYPDDFINVKTMSIAVDDSGVYVAMNIGESIFIVKVNKSIILSPNLIMFNITMTASPDTFGAFSDAKLVVSDMYVYAGATDSDGDIHYKMFNKTTGQEVWSDETSCSMISKECKLIDLDIIQNVQQNFHYGSNPNGVYALIKEQDFGMNNYQYKIRKIR